MLKKNITISQKDLGGQFIDICIPMCQTVNILKENLEPIIVEKIDENINPIIDYEKIRYKASYNFIKYTLKNLTYSDFGITNDDLKFSRDRFNNSFLRIEYYDSIVTSNRRLVAQTILYTYISDDQRLSTGQLKDVSNMPITFYSYNPNNFSNIFPSEGYNFYWYKNDSTRLYAYITYNNAVDGKVTSLLSYNSPLQLNNIPNFNYIPIDINLNGTYSFDTTGRVINENAGNIEICLYPL